MKKAFALGMAILVLLPALAWASPAQDLLKAVNRNDPKTAKSLLAKGADPNALADSALKRTVFHVACSRGNLEIVKLLLQYKADPRKKDSGGWQAFHFASSGLHDKVLELLLKSGVDPGDFRAWVNASEYEGFNQLHIASREGQFAMVKIFAEWTASIDAKTEAGWTALALACSTIGGEGKDDGRASIVKLLLGKGADPFMSGPEGRCPFDYLVLAGRKDLTALVPLKGVGAATAILAYDSGDGALFEKVLPAVKDLNAPDAEGRILLIQAILKGDSFRVSDLLKRGADPARIDRDGRSPLGRAAETGSIEIMGLLIAAGTDPDSGSSQGALKSALGAAILAKKNDAVAFLISRGARVSTPGRYLPLQAAIYADNLDAFKLLAEKGADLNQIGENFSPLHTAVRYHANPPGTRLPFIEYLIVKGADVNLSIPGFGTPLDWALSQGCEREAALLRAAGGLQSPSAGGSQASPPPNPGEALFQALNAGDRAAARAAIDALPSLEAEVAGGRTALYFLVRDGDSELAAYAISKGARTEVLDNGGVNLLMTACESRKLETAKLLFSKGTSDVNGGDARGRTPLMYCSMSPDIAAWLLSLGADPKARDSSGNTAFHYLSGFNAPEALAAMKLLLDRGADPNLFAAGGKSPLQRAKQVGYQEMVDLLLSHGAVNLEAPARGRRP